SLDEAFLDVRGARRLLGTPVEIAHELRRRVLDEEGLTCSVGIARVKFLAKIATGRAKPTASPAGPVFGPGVFEVAPADELAFLHALPVRALWGVGPATHERLARLGVSTVGDLARVPEAALVASLGAASGAHLHALAHARDPRPVVPDVAPKSISHEETFPRDRHERADLEVEVVRLADAVGARLRAAEVLARTVTLKVRFGDFSTITRSTTVAGGVDSGHRLAELGRHLLSSVDVAQGVRLLGLAASQLDAGADRQLSLDDLLEGPGAPEAGWADAEGAVDAVRARFGSEAVGPASLAGPRGLRVARRGQQAWGPDAEPG
ncbi:MAG: DNA polymerase IV, partial [Acidimicrobiales bacterium]|nr:DNA polymerase IV [Acidimicrobiales bacterium]